MRWSTVTRTAKELTVAYHSVNPATGEVLKTFTEHTNQEMMASSNVMEMGQIMHAVGQE